MKYSRMIYIAAFGLAVLAAVALARMHGQGQYEGEAKEGEMSQGQSDGSLSEHGQAVMAYRQQVHEWMQQQDQMLQDKVEAMDEASGDAKIEAMADVVRELVDQRMKMHEKMADMCNKTMGHMAHHMMGCMGQESQQAMRQCPLMDDMEIQGHMGRHGGMMHHQGMGSQQNQ